MQTLSSANRTCMASASAVECTATVGMPSSLQARSTRSAISPRLAISSLSNIGPAHIRRRSLDDDQRLAELDRLAVFEQDLRHRAGARRGNLIHRLHRLYDEKHVAGLHRAADVDERFCSGLGRAIG